MVKARYCLDSWAVIRHIEGDTRAGRRVDRVLAGERSVMSWINLGEVWYWLHRDHGARVAEELTQALRSRLTLDEPSPERVLAAARIKAVHRMSYADAFAVATARAHDATLLTGDPELTTLDVGCKVEDLARR